MKATPQNDGDRAELILQNQELYEWWKSTGLSLYHFVKANRSEIDDRIDAVLNQKPDR